MITKIDQQKRTKWATTIKQRDKNCRRCKSMLKLQAHHIFPWSWFNQYNLPDLRFDTKNGITLCNICHDAVIEKTTITIKEYNWLLHQNTGILILQFKTPAEQLNAVTERDLFCTCRTVEDAGHRMRAVRFRMAYNGLAEMREENNTLRHIPLLIKL